MEVFMIKNIFALNFAVVALQCALSSLTAVQSSPRMTQGRKAQVRACSCGEARSRSWRAILPLPLRLAFLGRAPDA
jgi:hypothetical protein